jgi:hypothetical protein
MIAYHLDPCMRATAKKETAEGVESAQIITIIIRATTYSLEGSFVRCKLVTSSLAKGFVYNRIT